MHDVVRNVEQKGMGMLKEFRDFAMKGNVVDLAVGVIIGAAFGAIVTSLVGDIIMPVIGSITGGLDFSNYFTGLSKAVTASNLVDAKKQGAVLAWGNFLTLTLNFVIIAFVLFMIIRAMNKLKRKDDAAAAAPPPPKPKPNSNGRLCVHVTNAGVAHGTMPSATSPLYSSSTSNNANVVSRYQQISGQMIAAATSKPGAGIGSGGVTVINGINTSHGAPSSYHESSPPSNILPTGQPDRATHSPLISTEQVISLLPNGVCQIN